MKKFCSTCGNQLELSQRFCIECGAVNPFFISAFTLLSDQSDELEKLRLEKERIDKELQEKEEKQAEFIRQEKLRKESEESEKLKSERLENERLKKEYQDRAKMELIFKEEIQRVKDDSEQHKKETIDLVKEVREELQQLEEDNKQLMQAIRALSDAGTHEPGAGPLKEESKPQGNKGNFRYGVVVLLFIVLFGIGGTMAYVYISNKSDIKPVASSMVLQPAPVAGFEVPGPAHSDTVQSKDTANALAEIPAAGIPKKDTVPLLIHSPASVKPDSVVPKPNTEFILSPAKIKRDLIGKKISGCGIVIKSGSEIKGIGNLVMVEKLSNGFLKYKFSAVIEQEGETYNAVPYIYYTVAGAFIKLDGTNCE